MKKKPKKKGFSGEKMDALFEKAHPKHQISNVSRLNPPQAQLNSLLECYQNRRNVDAERLAMSIAQEFPKHQFAWKVLGAVLKQTGRINESLVACQKSVQIAPHDASAHSNLGIALQELDRIDEAEVSYRQAIALKPDYAEAHSNLGTTLKKLGRLDEAEGSYTQAIALEPDYAKAHYNLGITLQELGRLDEADASYTQSIALKPDYAQAHYNLGNTLQELGRLEEAEASYTQAIALKPDYAEAYSNLGNTLEELGRLDEAGVTYRQAVELKPDFALAHSYLSKVLYIKGYKDLALESIEKANHFDPQSKDFRLLLSVMKSRKSRQGSEAVIGGTANTVALTGLTSSPLILNRAVEAELIANIYEMSAMEIDNTKRYGLLASGKNDARFGNGICSPDFDLFKDSRSIIQTLAEDLTRTMMEAVKSDIYIFDSFFNVLRAGGGSTPHNHINKLDENIGLNLGKQKYSLVYYLSVGDQDCSEPGVLKLYEPEEDILPSKGMIMIVPASRPHSAVYSGKTDRIMIGVNFYSL
jgi:Flp pilus assembly protein TadD